MQLQKKVGLSRIKNISKKSQILILSFKINTTRKHKKVAFWKCETRLNVKFYLQKYTINLPIKPGKATEAGPGLLNSAAMGPRRLVGVQGLC